MCGSLQPDAPLRFTIDFSCGWFCTEGVCASLAFQYFETEEYVVAVPHRRERKPRVFIVQPQRLFEESFRQMLTNDFEVAGVGPTLCGIQKIKDLDLIVADADALRVPVSALVTIPAFLGCKAIVCLLSRDPSAWHRTRRAESLISMLFPRPITDRQIVQTLLRLVVRAKAFGATPLPR